MIKYTGSQWSFAQVRVPLTTDPTQIRHTRAIVTDSRVFVATHCNT